MEKFGASSREQIQLQMRTSIKAETSNKRKSIEPLQSSEETKRLKIEEVKDEPNTTTELDDSMESEKGTDKAKEFSCDYCSGDVSFPIFNLLVVHIKNEHPSELFFLLKIFSLSKTFKLSFLIR